MKKSRIRQNNQRAYLLTLLLIPAGAMATIAQPGCAQQKLMETPTIVSLGGIDPFKAVPPDRQTAAVPVFVVSSRTVSGRDNPAEFYTDERSRVLRLGRASVTIGSRLDWPELVETSTARRRSRDPDIRLTGYEEFGVLWSTVPPPQGGYDPEWNAPGSDREPANRFLDLINTMLAESRRAQITIYVHGFNTQFDDDLGIAAELWHYMGRDGVMIAFEWPSRASVLQYQADKANAAYATRQFRELLSFLAANTQADRINVLAHSAGSPIVIESLRDLSLLHRGLELDELRARTKIGRVVLAAPDMDLLVAVNAGLDGAGRVPEWLAIYASTRDSALGFSAKIFGADRLGASVNRLSDQERANVKRSSLQAIDVTAAEQRRGSLLGHSYYHENPWVSSDVALFLAVGATPEERGLVRDDKTAFWSFPNDYEECIADVGQRLLARYGRDSRQVGNGEATRND